jgi:hypothetical protein
VRVADTSASLARIVRYKCVSLWHQKMTDWNHKVAADEGKCVLCSSSLKS